jgi:hypothetical protein
MGSADRKEGGMNGADQIPQLPREARGKRPQFYETPGLDHAMSMILVLANEMMVMRDRLDTVERVAASKGIFLEEDVEAYQPDQQVLDIREQRRQDFLERLYYVARKEVAELSAADTKENFQRTLEEIAKR